MNYISKDDKNEYLAFLEDAFTFIDNYKEFDLMEIIISETENNLENEETGTANDRAFDAYNESEVLITAIENYKKRTGHYPERALADQIYRNRTNIAYCKEHNIRLSGKKLGRPKQQDTDKKTEYRDNTDRIEVERKFSLSKRKFGLGLLHTKLKNTTESSIILSIIAMNIDRLAALFLRFILFFLSWKLKCVGWGC